MPVFGASVYKCSSVCIHAYKQTSMLCTTAPTSLTTTANGDSAVRGKNHNVILCQHPLTNVILGLTAVRRGHSFA